MTTTIKIATNNTNVDSASIEKFLAAKKIVSYKHNAANAKIWYVDNRRSTKTLATKALKPYGLTIDTYLAAQKQWVDAEVAKSCAAVNAELEIKTSNEPNPDDYAVSTDAQQMVIDTENDEEPLTPPIIVETELADGMIRTTNDFWSFVVSDKYDAAITNAWNDVRTYYVSGKEVSEQEFFDLMAERGACQILADDFNAQLAKLKATEAAAKAIFNEKESELAKVSREVEKACDAYGNAKDAITQFYAKNALELSATIGNLPSLKLIRQDGTETFGGSTLEVIAHYDKDFADCFVITTEGISVYGHCGYYYTPAQVTTVINRLKDAVKRGDTEFTFPTVDDLNHQTAMHNSHVDSLVRAMKIALDRYKDFCRVGQLSRAEHELQLYDICRQAKNSLTEEVA